MTSIALLWEPGDLAGDFEIKDGDLVADDGLRSCVILSLFTDRQAEPGDVLPDGVNDRRGWWADGAALVPADKFGSRLWLLARSKQTPDVLSRATEYSKEALQWLLDDRIAEAIEVTAEFLPQRRGYLLGVIIARPGTDDVTYRFNQLWDSEGARA